MQTMFTYSVQGNWWVGAVLYDLQNATETISFGVWMPISELGQQGANSPHWNLRFVDSNCLEALWQSAIFPKDRVAAENFLKVVKGQ